MAKGQDHSSCDGRVGPVEIEGEQLNAGPETVPRPAASVMVVRGGSEELEVLLVRRNPAARFVGGAWVFPGGAVDANEGHGEAGSRAAAIREVSEEAGIELPGPEQLVLFSRWITPSQVKTRFDTWFYIAALPVGANLRVDGSEIVDGRWYAPATALQASRRGELQLVSPTIKHLEQLATFGSVEALLAHAHGREVRAVQPRVVVSGKTARTVLPGEPGYSD